VNCPPISTQSVQQDEFLPPAFICSFILKENHGKETAYCGKGLHQNLPSCTHLSPAYIKPCDSPLLSQPDTPPSSTNRDHEEISSASSGLLTVVLQFLRRDSSSSLQEERHQAEAAGRHQKGQEAQEGGAAFQCRRREAQLHLQGCDQVLYIYIIIYIYASHLCISIVCCVILSISIRILSLCIHSCAQNLSARHCATPNRFALVVPRHATESSFLEFTAASPSILAPPPHRTPLFRQQKGRRSQIERERDG
jgi:hypothetical protein